MSIDVSVVVATYNTGDKLDALLGSLTAQTLPPEQFEVVVVDDGSTDDTWTRLQEAAEATPNLHLERIPNSGWPGRPRNVGTDLARGRYVFYADHDDELFPEALERMVALGDRADADVVVGKEVRSGARTIGAEAFLADRERADLFDNDVLAILTPHKLFRTAFLREHGIRFPEGRRRLEDHVLLAEVYTRTDRIAVLASYPCYRWIIYPDGSNNSDDLGDLDVYFSSLADVFDVLDRADITPEQRDRLTQFWYATRMLRRLAPFWFDKWTPEYRDEAVKIIADLASERIPPRLDAGLPPVLARRAALLREGDFAGIVARADADRDVHLRTDDVRVRWDDGRLTISLRGTLAHEDSPVALVTHRDGLFLTDDVARQHDIAPFLDEAYVDLSLRRPKNGVEWYANQPIALRPIERDGMLVLEATGTFVIDPTDVAFGSPLDRGRWSVYAHGQALGYTTRPRLLAESPGPAIVDGIALRTLTDDEGRLTLVVDAPVGALADLRTSLTVAGRGHRARVGVDLSGVHVRNLQDAAFGFRILGEDVSATLSAGDPVHLDARLEVPSGRHPVRLTLGSAAGPPIATLFVGRWWQRVETAPPRWRRALRRLARSLRRTTP
ncbi:glycosyltransferase family 2 protein [Mumia sp. ZJ430]|uniref:glycosyltransferase family 2 protein n=1 Tax=Mumia sp. ZJ430 TaxID=2708083 RepID=UPI0014225940|nr:glycosyltransferase family 2 protein [Mumia sp. ZJ430]